MLYLKNLIKEFSEFKLHIEELTIKEGETVALIGNNGAGKTTLLRCLLNLISFESGSIEIFNHSIKENEEWKTKVNSYLDERFLIDFLTPKEFLKFTQKAYNQPENTELSDFLEPEYYLKLIRELSTGNKQKVGILSALVTNPKLLILDEPFANLDPRSRYRLSALLKNSKQTQIISSHDLTEVIEIADRVILMEKGNIIRDVTCDNETIDQLNQYFENS